MKRIGLSLALLLSLVVSALAQGGMGPGPGTVHSAGSSASIAALVAGNSTCATTPCTVISGQTFVTGVAVVGVVISTTGGLLAPTSVTIKGVSGTQIGSTISDGTTAVQMWYAAVTSGTGNIDLAAGGSIGLTCLSSWTVTGALSNTPTANNSFNGLSATQADPQGPLGSLTVSSGGVAGVFIGGTFHTVTANPTTWAQATRDASLETGNAGGNQCASAGSHISAAGTYTGITATGSLSWLYAAMIGAAWQ